MPIALIVVCRNVLSALQKTLSSIRSLGDPRVRLIIIDGASTDGTVAFVNGLGEWPFYTCSEPDQGIYDAMNKGWKAAPLDSFILYLGAGDLLYELPNDALLREISGSPMPLVLGETRVGALPFRSRWRSEIRLRNTAHHQAMMLLKQVSPEPPFDAKLRVYADWDFNLRLFRNGLTAVYVPGLRTYAAPGGASWSIDTAEIFRVARRHSGVLIGAVSWTLNSISRWRRIQRDKMSTRREQSTNTNRINK